MHVLKVRTEDYEDQHEGYSFVTKERILAFCAAMNMRVGYTFFKKRKVIY